MKKLLTFVLFLVLAVSLAGCDFLDPELVDQLRDIAEDYCEENPDNEYCNLDFEAELEKAEVKFADYFEDYSNSEYTHQEIADMYFEGEMPEGFEEDRAADLEAGTVLTLVSLDFRLDGGFNVQYNATTGDDIILRKRPGRVKYDLEAETASIEWYDGEDNDCDDVCDDVDTTKEVIEQYLMDYADPEMSNQELADKYYGGKLTDEFAAQRDMDLENEISFVLLEVLEVVGEDWFEITYEEMTRGNDKVVRKRPGRTVYKNESNLIIWDDVDQDCDGVDDDCN